MPTLFDFDLDEEDELEFDDEFLELLDPSDDPFEERDFYMFSRDFPFGFFDLWEA